MDVLLSVLCDSVASSSCDLLIAAAEENVDKSAELLDCCMSSTAATEDFSLSSVSVSAASRRALSSILVSAPSAQGAEETEEGVNALWLPLENDSDGSQVQSNVVYIRRGSCVVSRPFVLHSSAAKALCSILLAVRP
jgi:hypothetical protein